MLDSFYVSCIHFGTWALVNLFLFFLNLSLANIYRFCSLYFASFHEILVAVEEIHAIFFLFSVVIGNRLLIQIMIREIEWVLIKRKQVHAFTVEMKHGSIQCR